LYKVVAVEDRKKLDKPLLAAFVVPNKPIPRKDALFKYA